MGSVCSVSKQTRPVLTTVVQSLCAALREGAQGKFMTGFLARGCAPRVSLWKLHGTSFHLGRELESGAVKVNLNSWSKGDPWVPPRETADGALLCACTPLVTGGKLHLFKVAVSVPVTAELMPSQAGE